MGMERRGVFIWMRQAEEGVVIRMECGWEILDDNGRIAGRKYFQGVPSLRYVYFYHSKKDCIESLGPFSGVMRSLAADYLVREIWGGFYFAEVLISNANWVEHIPQVLVKRHFNQERMNQLEQYVLEEVIRNPAFVAAG